jgi:hypothetical protein
MTLEEQKKYDSDKQSSSNTQAGIVGGVSLLQQLMELKALREKQRKEAELAALESIRSSNQNASNNKQSGMGDLMTRYGGLI